MPFLTMADGTEIFYRAAGSPKLGVALFVHPFTHDNTVWTDQLYGLQDVRRCLAIDLRGHGRSDPNPSPVLTTTEHVSDLCELVDSVEGPIDLVGLAYGGVLSALTYEQRPERIRSLTMISPGFSTGPTDAATKRYTEEIGRIAVVEDKGIVFRRWLEYVVSPSAPLFAKARYRSILDRTPTETLVNYLVNNKIAPRPDLPGKLKCPVFLPVGADDSVVDMDGPLGQIADLHITKLESAGRLPPLEAPAAFNAALRAFWAGLGD